MQRIVPNFNIFQLKVEALKEIDHYIIKLLSNKIFMSVTGQNDIGRVATSEPTQLSLPRMTSPPDGERSSLLRTGKSTILPRVRPFCAEVIFVR